MISIITPSLNSDRFIEQTIRSVLDQDYPEIEYIVVDGGSTDKTIDILKNFEGRIAWTAERDAGQAGAINDGFRIAKGDVLGWLNADDLYQDGALRDVARKFDEGPDLMMAYGDGELIDENGRLIEKYPCEEFRLEALPYACFICQPACFFRRSLLEIAGNLDSELRYAMDLDLWIRFGMLKKENPHWKFEYVRTTWACSRMHPTNKTLSQRQESYQEVVDVIRRYYGFVPFNWIYGLEEIADGKHDAFFNRSPFSLSLIAKSAVKWVWMNNKRPDHIIRFAATCVTSPKQSLNQLMKRTGYRT